MTERRPGPGLDPSASERTPAPTGCRSERFRAQAAPLFARAMSHGFVAGLADGTLPQEAFVRWIVQDHIYLETYAEVLARAVEIAPDGAARLRWTELRELTVHHELPAQKELAARFDLALEALVDPPAGPATRAYTAFLLEHARAGYGSLVAAVVPCGVDYMAIAQDLAARPPSPEPRYAEWVRTYDDPAFYDTVAFMEGELDRVDGDEATLYAIYHEGARHELAFWDQLLEP